METALANRLVAGWSQDGAAWGAAYLMDGRWKVDVNHRHAIFEGNTMLNFAGKSLVAEHIGQAGTGECCDNSCG